MFRSPCLCPVRIFDPVPASLPQPHLPSVPPCPFAPSLPPLCSSPMSPSSFLSLPRHLPPRLSSFALLRGRARARPQAAGRRPSVRPGWASAWLLSRCGERQLFAISGGPPQAPPPPCTGRGPPRSCLRGGKTPETPRLVWEGGFRKTPPDIQACPGRSTPSQVLLPIPSWGVLSPFLSMFLCPFPCPPHPPGVL